MTKEQADKLLDLIDAKFSEFAARNSSDGGLSESIRVIELTKEFYETLENNN